MDNTTEMFCSAGTCSIRSMGTGMDPLEVKGTIAAGTVGGESFDTGCQLARIYFPDQNYRAGFAPEAAQCHGTLFPELVRLYE